MEKVEKRTSLECLQEEIRIFRKNEEATYDMLALYELLLQNTNIHNLIGITLTEKVIHDLEEPEVTVPFQTDNINDLFRMLTDRFYAIIIKYKDIEECKKNCDEFNSSYKDIVAQRDMTSLLYRKENIRFNLIQSLLDQSPYLVYKFLVSEISFNTRLDMFACVLASYNHYGFNYFLNADCRDYLSKEEYNKLPLKKQELLDAFNRNECKNYTVQNLLDHLLQDNCLNFIITF